jgi:putative ABC transport system permease protein
MTRWRRLLTRTRHEAQLDNELQLHVEEHAAELAAAGRARLALGGSEQVKEQCRDARGTRWLDNLMQDVRYALRTLGRRPGVTAVIVGTLALGIGAVTAILSVVNPVLLESLPYPEASRVVSISDQSADFHPVAVTFGTYRELLARSRSFETLAVSRAWQATIVGADRAEQVNGQRVSAAYFRVLGIEPIVGRGFSADDDRERGPNVVVIADALWRRRFDADPAIVGRAIALDGASFTVLGIMPRGFENIMAPMAEVWAPLQYDPSLPTDGREWGHHLTMVGRLRGPIRIEDARRELATIASTARPDYVRPPWARLGNGLRLRSMQDQVTEDVKPALVAVAGAVLLLLAIACVNVTGLQLARGAERHGEFAVRTALGAGRARLVGQLLTESVLLTMAGGVVGVLVANASLGSLLALAPSDLPRAAAIRIDSITLGLAAAISAVVALVSGVVPALHAARRDVTAGLQHVSSRVRGRQQAARRMLVVAEIGLAVVLLVGAGLLVHSLSRLFAIAPGFEPAHVVTMQVQTAGERLANAGATHRFFATAVDAVRAVPGVDHAGFTSQLPLSGSQDAYGVRLESSAEGTAEGATPAFRYGITPGYFDAMGIALHRGRLIEPRDIAGAPLVVVVSESLARRFPRGDVLGRRLQIGATDAPWRTVIGVVGDVRQVSLAVGESDAFYVPSEQWDAHADRARWLVVRARGEAAAFAAAITAAVWSVDKDQPIARITTLDSLVERSEAKRRFALVIFEAFASAALLLAAIGLYGLLSASVAERTREIGVRAALGASRRDILVLIVSQGMALVAIGSVAGIAAGAVASRTLVTLLFGVSPLDPATYGAVVALLAAVALVACSVPAGRATRVDPAVTLRSE